MIAIISIIRIMIGDPELRQILAAVVIVVA
jgi:hypothetical protein